jgi:RNA polymerase sigma-70 factor (ECF subfamily)
MTEIVFLKAWENLPGFGSRNRGFNFRAWLYRIAHNTLVDHHRTAKDEVALDAVPEQASRAPHMQQLIEESQQLETIMRSLDQLDATSRQVIVLRFFSGLDSKETAQVLGISAGNVRVIQYRALKKIRDLMGEEDE